MALSHHPKPLQYDHHQTPSQFASPTPSAESRSWRPARVTPLASLARLRRGNATYPPHPPSKSPPKRKHKKATTRRCERGVRQFRGARMCEQGGGGKGDHAAWANMSFTLIAPVDWWRLERRAKGRVVGRLGGGARGRGQVGDCVLDDVTKAAPRLPCARRGGRARHGDPGDGTQLVEAWVGG
jgi:hypothetical protein